MNVGRWMPQGGAEGEEFKMLQETQRTVDSVDLRLRQVDYIGPWWTMVDHGPLMFRGVVWGSQAIASSFRRTRTGDAVPGSAHA